MPDDQPTSWDAWADPASDPLGDMLAAAHRPPPEPIDPAELAWRYASTLDAIARSLGVPSWLLTGHHGGMAAIDWDKLIAPRLTWALRRARRPWPRRVDDFGWQVGELVHRVRTLARQANDRAVQRLGEHPW